MRPSPLYRGRIKCYTPSVCPSDPLLTKIPAKNDIYIFVSSDLDLWDLDLKFALQVTHLKVMPPPVF